ncbi:helix-turn-helix domain-containing protein [Streptomyces sp. NPDC002580]|uniref:helix-turn-helix domain-containing protein n=1 Tax=Streptomyces sp. NPDC002580 TaxID=3364653 RepID=UPI0036CD667B
MSDHVQNEARVIPLRPVAAPAPSGTTGVAPAPVRRAAGRGPAAPASPVPTDREPLWRDLVGDVLRRERLAQERTLKDVADAARISMPYLSEVERGRKEASSEVLAAAARALGLGLTDLLTLARHELARHELARHEPARRARAGSGPGRSVSSTSTPTSRHDGICLAA